MHFTHNKNISSSYWILCVSRDVMSLGITLVGHQKKIMNSIQTMRAQMLHLHGTGVQVWWTATSHRGQNGSGAAARQNQDKRLMSTHVYCVWHEIVPFSSVKDWDRLFWGRPQQEKGKTQQQNETTWMRPLPFLFVFPLAFLGVTDPTTYQMAQYNLMI